MASAVVSSMKYHHQLGFCDAWITQFEAEELMRIKPLARVRSGFGCSLTTDDPNGDEFIRQAIEILRRHAIPRLYEPNDLTESGVLLVAYQPEIQTLTEPLRDPQGRLLFKASSAKQNLKVGCIFGNWIIVSDQVRRSLEAGRL